MDKKVTVKEAAERLGVSVRRVHALIAAGRLPVERFANVFAIKESDLALVADRKPGRPPKPPSDDDRKQDSAATPRQKKSRKKKGR